MTCPALPIGDDASLSAALSAIDCQLDGAVASAYARLFASGGALSTAQPVTVTKFGNGILNINGAQSHTAGSTFVATAGVTNFNTNAGAPGSANLALSATGAGARVNLNVPQHLAALSISGGATIDAKDNAVTVDYAGSSPATSIRSLLASASLMSSLATAQLGLGYFDNGDTVQGTALSDYQALVSPVQCSDMIAIYKQMKLLSYDAATMGNHEFNYGLPFLSQITNVDFGLDGIGKGTAQTNPAGAKDCAAPAFPFVSANVVSAASKQPIFKPWVLLDKTFQATDASGKAIDVPLNWP